MVIFVANAETSFRGFIKSLILTSLRNLNSALPAAQGCRKEKRMYDETVKDRIFHHIIWCEISNYTSLYAPGKAVVSISNLLYLLGNVTKYSARQALKRLIADGLIEYTSQGCPAVMSYGEVPELVEDAAPPINGYALTKKGFETPEWKNAYKEWCKSMEEWANMGGGEEDD